MNIPFCLLWLSSTQNFGKDVAHLKPLIRICQMRRYYSISNTTWAWAHCGSKCDGSSGCIMSTCMAGLFSTGLFSLAFHMHCDIVSKCEQLLSFDDDFCHSTLVYTYEMVHKHMCACVCVKQKERQSVEVTAETRSSRHKKWNETQDYKTTFAQ